MYHVWWPIMLSRPPIAAGLAPDGGGQTHRPLHERLPQVSQDDTSHHAEILTGYEQTMGSVHNLDPPPCCSARVAAVWEGAVNPRRARFFHDASLENEDVYGTLLRSALRASASPPSRLPSSPFCPYLLSSVPLSPSYLRGFDCRILPARMGC